MKIQTKLVLALSLSSLTFCTVSGAKQSRKKPVLTMQLFASKTTLTSKQGPQITVSITNNGKSPVTLVHPGDGSESGWRTPIIKWLVRGADSSTKWTEPKPVPRCGNINPLTPESVFTLAPGETRKLEAGWIGFPSLSQAGRYKVTVSYSNLPKMKWFGISLGANDEKAMKRVVNSTECSLVSNSVIFTVKK